MSGGHNRANPGFSLGNGRKADTLGKDAFLEEPVGETHRQRCIADDDGRDRALAGSRVEPQRAQPALEECRVLPELLHPLRLGLEHFEGGDAGGRDRRRMRRREEERTRTMPKVLDERARAGNVAAQHPNRLGQRADLDVDATVKTEVIDGTAACRAEHAACMCIVHHHDGADSVGDVAQLRQRAEVAEDSAQPEGEQQRD